MHIFFHRIKTNGSLPRDKRQCTSPSQTTDEQMFHFDDKSPDKSWSKNVNLYENVTVNQFQQVIVSSTPNSDNTSIRYENIEISNLDINSPYENVVISNGSPAPITHSPRTRIKTYIPSAHKDR